MGLLIYKYTDLPIYQSTDLPIYQSANLPIYRIVRIWAAREYGRSPRLLAVVTRRYQAGSPQVVAGAGAGSHLLNCPLGDVV